MGALLDVISYLAKPLVLGLIALVLLGLLNEANGPRVGAGVGFECRGFTNDPAWNRTLCQYHPGRLLDRPVTDFLPGFLTEAIMGDGVADGTR